jgi:sugar O-acyltransferase (sialic acid O-acetyltransferase NeuD family)
MTSGESNAVVVFGAGGHAKVVVATLERAGWRVQTLYDDDPAKIGGRVLGVPVLGANYAENPGIAAVIAIGDNATRERIAAGQPRRGWATVIHPQAQVDPSARIGPGAVVFAGAIVQAEAQIGAHVIVNTGATIDHDCVIEDFAHIAPGAHLAGGVHVGRGALLGIGSAAVPGVSIGDWTTVGAGAVVTHDLPERVVAVGVPAKVQAAPTAGNLLVERAANRLPYCENSNGELAREVPFFAPWPSFAEDEIEAAMAVLRSGRVNYWTGDEGRLFEREFAEYTGCRHAVAVANGTLALELALYALGIGPGDEVIVPSRTFIASASCVVARGAVPVIADVDRESQNLTADSVRAVVSPNTKAIIAVHLAGWPCDMGPLAELARQHNLKLIEDCAQAAGATYKGRPVGCLGDVAAFSFCQDKIISTGGEGGMLTTNDASLWERAWSYKDHGKSWSAVYQKQHDAVFKWLHESFGSNYRLTEMQSAIGRAALRKLPQSVDKRRRNAARLAEAFAKIPALRLTVPPEFVGHSYYKYYVFVRAELLAPGWNRDRIVRTLQDEGVPCGSGSCSEIYLEGAFQRAGLRPPKRLPVAHELGETSLMFLVHPTLSDEAIGTTCNAVRRIFAAASRGATVAEHAPL